MVILYWLLIGAAAGWISGLIMKGRGFGVMGNIIVGILGSIIGGWLFNVIGIYTKGGLTGSIATAVVGAVVLLGLLNWLRK